MLTGTLLARAAAQGLDGFPDALPDPGPAENPDYLSKQLITCLGNKRSLLGFIGLGLEKASRRLGKSRLGLFDVFSGSGAVSRYLKRFASRLVVNDLERYAEVASLCYLANRSALDLPLLAEVHAAVLRRLRTEPLRKGFIRELYAPRDGGNITRSDRVFYTPRNASFLDSARQHIEEVPAELRPFLVGPLLSEASIHANTSGVFKGFHKDSSTGIGRYGGGGGDALSRIEGDMDLPFPVLSDHECEVEIHRGDANEVAGRVAEVDLAYLDPPYNQHPYGSNYFMLNLVADYRRPERISEVSGIPVDWNRSPYNSQRCAREALEKLVADIRARIILLSFNSEGFVTRREMEGMLGRLGRLEVIETGYNAFRGSRNMGGRSPHVREYLFLLEKS